MGMKYSDKRSFNDGEWTHSIRSLSKFQTSWDWLMPVVGKITRDERHWETDQREHLMDIVPYARLEEVYDTVVEFIKTYNNER